MGPDVMSADRAILDVLRKRDAMTVADLSEFLGVTATAVRQRLTRLLAQGLLQRESCREGRGRPVHQYSLTAKGRRRTGANMSDLALVLWQEMRSISDPEVRRGLLGRLSHRLASIYGGRFAGDSVEERMESLAELMGERQIPFEVDRSSELPVLKALACPYPELAEMDRGVCAMEREFVSEVLGQDVRLGQCRLDGDNCCSFEVRDSGSVGAAASRLPT